MLRIGNIFFFFESNNSANDRAILHTHLILSLKLDLLKSYILQRHWCTEQSFGLCGRGRGWDDLGEWHWNAYNIIYGTSHQSRLDAGYWMLGAGALGRPRGMVWGGRREEGSGWGTHIYLWWIHFEIWQNQYNIVKFKNKIKFKKRKKRDLLWTLTTLHTLLCMFYSFCNMPFSSHKNFVESSYHLCVVYIWRHSHTDGLIAYIKSWR